MAVYFTGRENMKSESLRKSEKASFSFKLRFPLRLKSGTQGRIFKQSDSLWLFAAGALVFALLLSQSVFAAEFCSGASAIDQAPFFIGQAFSDILNRTPGGGEGQRFWISRLEGLNASSCRSANPALSAGSCEWNNDAQIVLNILSSPESASKNGNLASNDAFVTALYKLLLRRAPDGPGLKSHLSILDSGGTRLSVVSTFLSSEEYRHRFTCTATGTSNPSCGGAEFVDPIPSFVAQTHRDIFGRDPDAASLASWTKSVTSSQVAMCQNVSATAFSVCDRVIEAQTVMDALMGSAYQKSNPPLADNKAFVTALYKRLLQRPPDVGGLQFHLKYLDDTNDRLGTIYSFLTSDEYRKRFTCYAGTRNYMNLGINGHPIAQPAYSDTDGVSFDDQLTLVHNAGAQWYRFDVGAPSVGGDFTKMDALLNKAQAHGLRLLPIIFATVDPAHDSPSTIYTKSYDGAFKIVSHYKSSIHVWELSNEEDVYSIAGSNGDQITDYDSHKYAIAAARLRGLAEGVRAADGGALRIINFGGWLHTGFFQRLEDDGIPYDIAGFHWYQEMGEITCPAQALPCPATPRYFNVVRHVQNITHGKPIWMTETNYSPLPTNTVAMNISRKEKYLTAVLQTYLNSPAVYPFQTVMVYELLDEPNLAGGGVTQTQMGMYSVTSPPGRKYALGSPKPEYQVLRSLFAH
jgi:hypothetical protein